MEETRIDIRLPKGEKQILDDYCEAAGRTRTDVLREFIRSLKRKTPKRVDEV
jgi:predicted DNA-binding protein